MEGQANFVRDNPDSLYVDAFGHRDYAETLVSIVSGDSPPPTLGVFGPWGVGKSTIIGAIQERLQGSATAFVYFDAWRYEGDSLRRQFLTEAAKQLDEDNRLRSYVLADELRELEVDTQELRETFSWSTARFKRAAVIGLGFATIALLAAVLGGFAALLGGDFGTKVLAALVVFTLTTLASALSQSVVVNPTTLTRRTLQDPDRFATKFAALLRSLESERLVIAIDNLDRCSPEKAVEMLGTIKTYLEPAVADGTLPRSSATEAVQKDVVFLIAVDDAALRRHLIAQEQARSVKHDAAAIHRYVDEYLAKFFNARLPIRPILDEDMRDYVDTHIRPLAEARSLDNAEARTLISLVASALRRNPRGVKQFRNDLESRLRLLEEREQEKDGERGIDPPVSGEVAMVAKLALIEAEWPGAFSRLQEDPRLLERWTTEAIGSSEVDWTAGGEQQNKEAETSSEAKDTRSRRLFGDFLRLSASTDSKHLRAMLSLKQSQIELKLPGYAEFREAIVNGDRAAAEEILGQVEEGARAGLAGRVPEFLRAELKAGYLDSARAAVDVVVSLAAFDPFDPARREVMTIAIEDPDLRSQLISLDPTTVLARAELLAPTLRHRLFEPYLARFLATAVGDRQKTPIAQALGPHAADLSAEQQDRVRRALADEMKSKFDLYLPLVRTASTLLPLEATDAAIEELERPRGQEPLPEELASLSERPEAVEVLDLGLRDPSINQEERTIRLVGQIFGIYADQEALLAADLPLFSQLLEPLEAPQEEFWAGLGRAIEARWGAVPSALRADVIALAELALGRADEGTRVEVGQTIASALFEDPDAGIEVSTKLETPPPSFQPPFVAHLTTFAGQPGHWLAASEALARIDGTDYPRWQVNAFHHLLASGHIEEAYEMLTTFEVVFDEHPVELASAAAPVLLDRANADLRTPAPLLAKLSELSSNEALDQLSQAYADRLAGPDGEMVAELLDELGPIGADRLRLSVAHHSIARLGAEPQPPPKPQLTVACRYVGELPAGDQRLLAAGLASRLRSRLDQAGEIAGHLAQTSALAAEPSKELVDALVDAETAVEDPDSRHALLSAANALRGRSNSLATKALRKRLDVLVNSDRELDQELGKKFLALLDG